MIKAVIFDKDGTLHDTEKVYHRAWRAAAEQTGVPDITDFVALCTGTNAHQTAILWQDFYGDAYDFPSFWALRDTLYDQIIEKDGLPIKEGAYELLDYLQANGIKIGLATSTNAERVNRHLELSDMQKYFDAVVTGDTVPNGKPAPDIFLIAAERMGTDPAQSMGVEDSFNGIRGLYAAGMKPVMVPDITLPTPEIQRMLWAQCRRLNDLIPLLERC